jgi:hypothetical protein
MRRYLFSGLAGLLGLLSCTATQPASSGTAQSTTGQPTTDIMLVAMPHLSQLYKKGNPLTDVLSPRRQTELVAFCAQIGRYRPDVLMVEELPAEQAHLDSLYSLYRQDKLNMNTLPSNRSEIYQVAFPLGKRLGLERIYCVNSEGGTSQSILHEGTNIKLYQDATIEHRAYYAPTVAQWEKGDVTMTQLLTFLNTPAFLQQLHRLVYRTPARVTDGTLKADPMVDSAFIKPHYVGAEFISVIYNRDLKIYSNIVNTQQATRASRVLTIIGGRHVESLQGIFGTDPAYRVVASSRYLK